MKKNIIYIDDSSKASAEEVDKSLENLFKIEELCSIASINNDITPHINTCFFVISKEYKAYILTPPSTKHSQNFITNNKVAMNLFNSKQVFGEEILGVQLFGTINKLDISKSFEAFSEYTKKYKIFRSWFPNISDISNNLESRFYELKIDHGKLIDEQNFGSEVYINFHVKRV